MPNVMPTVMPTPPTTIQASEPAEGTAGSPSQTANGSTWPKPINCTQAIACSAPIETRRAVVAGRRDAPRRRGAQRGRDREHQEMVPVVARTSTMTPSTTR